MSKREELVSLVSLIPSPIVQAFTKYVLDCAPSHFWVKPSSAGKYHPADEHGFEGLLLHTIRVAKVGVVLCESSKHRLDSSVILSACILHDICRYGDTERASQYSMGNHPELAADMVLGLDGDGVGSGIEAVCRAIRCHSGRWGRVMPSTEEEWAVHYADCIAANYHSWSSGA